jgi:hypothetical protein
MDESNNIDFSILKKHHKGYKETTEYVIIVSG